MRETRTETVHSKESTMSFLWLLIKNKLFITEKKNMRETVHSKESAIMYITVKLDL